ncbi:MAG TPA: hypothetical protein VE710_16605 [Candidatus Bathyarchaeia archaeon]|nr:hypothetical protein [Candidatus Bathyarchaeia archaeon]
MYRIKIWMCLLIASLFSMMNQSASATSWVDLKPEEVLQKAEVIVQGTYDFTADKQKVDPPPAPVLANQRIFQSHQSAAQTSR